ncbi:MAG: heme-binding protein [Anaerolineaceae bacterium]
MINRLSLGLEEAKIAIQTIEAEILRRGKAGVIAVADAHGELIMLVRMNNAPLPSTVIAANKAFSAARERKPTQLIGQDARDPQNGFDIAYFGDPRFIGWPGGIPVEVNGVVVGSVAVSGFPGEEDVELVKMGIEAIKKQ